jgi:putative transport protein
MLSMSFLSRLWPDDSVAAGLATLSLAVTLGLLLGAIRVRGLKLSISGVLFSSLLFGQIGLTVNPVVLSFLRDFSLILFAYAIGLQVGPGFVDSLKAEGLRLNLLSIAVLVVGAGMTAGIVWATHLNIALAPGLYSGAFTTTPGLAAGQEVLRHGLQADTEAAARLAGLAYAVTYPFGVIGPAFAIALFRKLFGVNIQNELADYAQQAQVRRPPSAITDMDVTNPELTDIPLRELIVTRGHNVIFSRLLRNGVMTVPMADTTLAVGDVVRAIGTKPALDRLVAQLGRPSKIDLSTISGDIGRKELLVTRPAVLRRTLRELDMINRHGVTLPRVVRSGVDLIPSGSLALHFGDLVTAVGPSAGLKAVEDELGNSPDELNRPQLMPIFLGIVLGVIVGSIPFAVPGIHGGVKFGLAAGPMLVAIVLSRWGSVGSVIWHMPAAANQLFRDFGLALFLACVGLQQGDHFVQKLLTGNGVQILLVGEPPSPCCRCWWWASSRENISS